MSLHRITIYGKPDCHLCDAAAEVVQKVVGNNIAVIIEKVDITDDAELLEKYQNDIPVIAIDGKDTFRHRVDPQELARTFYDTLGENLVGFSG
jgi:glutaredoxin